VRDRRSTETWTRSCGTAAKAGGNREHKLRPVVTEGSYLLEHDRDIVKVLNFDYGLWSPAVLRKNGRPNFDMGNEV
jgi:hypothetical protein